MINNPTKVIDKFKNVIANPWVIKTSKVATGLLDIASKLGQANLPGVLPKIGAGISILDTVVRNFEIEPKSALNEYVKEHKLNHVRSALGTCIISIGAAEQLDFQTLVQSKRDGLLGCVIDDEIFAVKITLGLAGAKPTNNCYYTENFDFSKLTNRLWEMLGDVAEITWNSTDWHSDLVPGHLRVCDRVDDAIQQEIREEIEHYTTCKVSYAAMLYGPPGTGKTTFVHNLAKTSGRKILTIRPDVIDRFEPQSIEVIFDALRPGVLLLDDVDRAEDGLVKLMSFMETVRDRYPGMVVFSTCNGFPANSALMRPGRLGQIIEFKSPSEKEKHELLTSYMTEYDSNVDKFDLDKLIAKMKHPYFSHDYVRMVAEKSTFLENKKLVRWTENLNMQIALINKKGKVAADESSEEVLEEEAPLMEDTDN